MHTTLVAQSYMHTSYKLSRPASAVFVGASCPHWQRHHMDAHAERNRAAAHVGGQRTTTVSMSNLCDETLYVTPSVRHHLPCPDARHCGANTARVCRPGTHPDQTRHTRQHAGACRGHAHRRYRPLQTPAHTKHPASPCCSCTTLHPMLAWWRNMHGGATRGPSKHQTTCQVQYTTSPSLGCTVLSQRVTITMPTSNHA
jgi:hypothetical protein